MTFAGVRRIRLDSCRFHLVHLVNNCNPPHDTYARRRKSYKRHVLHQAARAFEGAAFGGAVLYGHCHHSAVKQTRNVIFTSWAPIVENKDQLVSYAGGLWGAELYVNWQTSHQGIEVRSSLTLKSMPAEQGLRERCGGSDVSRSVLGWSNCLDVPKSKEECKRSL